MDFPRYVFTKEGEEICHLGTYGTELVGDEDELEAAKTAGYKENISELFKKEVEEKVAKKNRFKNPFKKENIEEDDF